MGRCAMDDKYLYSNDQNFKNLTADYPIQSIEFYAREVFPRLGSNVRATLLRQEQQKDDLYKHYRELDIPIKLEWPNGEKAIVIFAIEAESNPYKFSAARLAQYCLDLAKEHNTARIVPVVVFTKAGKYQEELLLGTEEISILQFQFIACQLPELNYLDWCDSNNIVARLTLPLMNYPKEERLKVVHKSTQGLLNIENNENLQRKYIPFITHYADLEEEDIIEYQQRYPEEGEIMASYTQRRMRESMEQGLEQGVQEGERQLFLRLLMRRFSEQVTGQHKNRIAQANSNELERWADNILDAKSVEEVFA